MMSIYKKKGFALVFLMTILVLVVISASVLYTSIYLSGNIFANRTALKQAYYAASAGIQYCLYIIKNPAKYDPLDRDGREVPDHKDAWPYRIAVDPFGDRTPVTVSIETAQLPGTGYTVTSTALTPNGKIYTVTAVVSQTGSVTSWR